MAATPPEERRLLSLRYVHRKTLDALARMHGTSRSGVHLTQE